jgi:hypothetical protein
MNIIQIYDLVEMLKLEMVNIQKYLDQGDFRSVPSEILQLVLAYLPGSEISKCLILSIASDFHRA